MDRKTKKLVKDLIPRPSNVSKDAQIDLDAFVEKLAGYSEEAQAHKQAAEQAYLEG